MELLRLLRGLAMVTRLNSSRSWLYSRLESRPRKILATKVPPGARTCAVMFRAASRSCREPGGGRRVVTRPGRGANRGKLVLGKRSRFGYKYHDIWISFAICERD